MTDKKKPTRKPVPMDDDVTPVGKPPEFKPVDLTQAHGFTAKPAHDDIAAAQRITAKVARLLARPYVGHYEQLVLARLALMAIAAGPKSVARDIAVCALKVVG